MKVDLKKLREAVKEFNQSRIWEGILDKKLNPIQRFDVLKERFMEAVELIPEEKEDELPDLVVDVYNALVDMEETESEPSKERGEEDFEEEEGDLSGEHDQGSVRESSGEEGGSEDERKGSGRRKTRIDCVVEALLSFEGPFTLDQWIEKANALYASYGKENKRETQSAISKTIQVLRGLGKIKKEGDFYRYVGD